MASKPLLNFLLLLLFLFSGGHSDVIFFFENLCSSSVWLAASPSIGDANPERPPQTFELFNMPDPWTGSVWARTNCANNASYYFSCDTGDCGTGIEDCGAPKPAYPATLLNFDIHDSVVSYELSLVHGQNVLVRIEPTGGSLVDGSGPCQKVDCVQTLGNVCPASLVAANRDGRYVGCNSACDVLKDPKYCCNGSGCQPDEYSLKFKQVCNLAHTYPGDKNPPMYTCSGATSYNITFCPI